MARRPRVCGVGREDEAQVPGAPNGLCLEHAPIIDCAAAPFAPANIHPCLKCCPPPICKPPDRPSALVSPNVADCAWLLALQSPTESWSSLPKISSRPVSWHRQVMHTRFDLDLRCAPRVRTQRLDASIAMFQKCFSQRVPVGTALPLPRLAGRAA